MQGGGWSWLTLNYSLGDAQRFIQYADYMSQMVLQLAGLKVMAIRINVGTLAIWEQVARVAIFLVGTWYDKGQSRGRKKFWTKFWTYGIATWGLCWGKNRPFHKKIFLPRFWPLSDHCSDHVPTTRKIATLCNYTVSQNSCYFWSGYFVLKNA